MHELHFCMYYCWSVLYGQVVATSQIKSIERYPEIKFIVRYPEIYCLLVAVRCGNRIYPKVSRNLSPALGSTLWTIA
jgi:hypothetical protein